MEKDDFIEILQGALLNFDNVSEEELVLKFKLNSKLAKIGVQLCGYLRSKNVNTN